MPDSTALNTITEARSLQWTSSSPVTSLACHPGGGFLAAGGLDGVVRVWDVQAGECLRVLSGHSGPVWSVAYDPGGGFLATAGGVDGVVRVWDVQTGECLRVLSGNSGEVWSVAYDPGGGFLATAGVDGVRVWDVQTGECVRIIGIVKPGSFGIGGYAVWDPRTDRLIEWAGEAWRALSWRTVDQDGIHIWPLETFQPETERRLSPEEWAIPRPELIRRARSKQAGRTPVSGPARQTPPNASPGR